MDTQIIKAVEVLKKGGVIIFPTDTVWGIGTLISSKVGLQKFYQIKQRDQAKPSQVLVSDLNIAKKYGNFTDPALQLATKYWPGALTMILPAHIGAVPDTIRYGRQTVGIRLPKHSLCQELLTHLGEGLVASSANIAGGEAPLKFDDISSELLDLVDMVISGQAGGESSSTIVDVTSWPIKILRQGELKVVV